jgi:thiamine-phosphate pyrophosphorylase
MRKHIERLHYISHEFAPLSQVEQILQVCQAGAKWVQYRSLKKSEAAIREDIAEIANICDDWGTTLIVTDHIHLKGELDIQGFHIDDPGVSIGAIRESLGDEFILGASATNLKQVIQHAQDGADYIGLGPFKPSITKPNTFELLTVEDYNSILQDLKAVNLEVPILAVGGIQLSDVAELFNTGIHGIAISASIYNAPSIESSYSDFYKTILDVT